MAAKANPCDPGRAALDARCARDWRQVRPVAEREVSPERRLPTEPSESSRHYYRGLLRLHAPDDVADAYDAFGAAADDNAGPQMTAARRSHLPAPTPPFPLAAATTGIEPTGPRRPC